MRILQINSVCGVGSTGRIAVDLYEMLASFGHEGMIAYGRGSSPESVNAYKISTTRDMYIHGALTRITDMHGFGSYAVTKALIDRIKEYDPNVIHLHNIHGYYINIEVLFDYLKHADKPVVWTLHDCWSFTGHCAYFDFAGCGRWEEHCFRCPQKNSYPASLLIDRSRWNHKKKKELFTSVKNMTIVTPSEWLAALARRSFLGKFPVRAINNGINLEVFRPRAVENGDVDRRKEKYGCEGQFVLLGVANIWEERKGLGYLLELAGRLDHRYRLIVIGVNGKQKESLPSNVIGIERTDDVHQLAEIYSMADVLVNPTLEDNFPTINLEALACGTPVITFETGGSPESIDETCGIVVPKGDVEGLMKAVLRIAENPIGSDACIARAQLFSKNDKYMEYMFLYNQMID